MQIGVFSNGNRNNTLAKTSYDEDLHEIILADRLGITEAWISEHGTFLAFQAPDQLPSADLFICKAAALTKQIKMGPGIRPLPFFHPLQVATDCAVCDHLTDGRYLAGFGCGINVQNNKQRGTFIQDPRIMFREAVDLILAAQKRGLVVEGLSFHVGSQCTNFENFVQAFNAAAAVMKESRERGHEIKILDIGGGFPAPYNKHVKPFPELARVINAEIDRLFAPDIQILAEPGRFLVATAATSVARVIGKAVRNGKRCYYIDDSVYHTFSGIIFDHCQYPLQAFRSDQKEVCAVFGQTCDGLDVISQSELLPDLDIEDLVYAENIGAYGSASATYFNGFPPAKVIHVNQ